MGSVLNTIIKSTADIWMFWPEWIIMMLLLGIYLTVQTYLHDDSCPAGYLGAGGLSRNATLRKCTGGAHRLVDLRLWGENNFYHSPTCKHDYGCVSYVVVHLLTHQLHGSLTHTKQVRSGRYIGYAHSKYDDIDWCPCRYVMFERGYHWHDSLTRKHTNQQVAFCWSFETHTSQS